MLGYSLQVSDAHQRVGLIRLPIVLHDPGRRESGVATLGATLRMRSERREGAFKRVLNSAAPPIRRKPHATEGTIGGAHRPLGIRGLPRSGVGCRASPGERMESGTPRQPSTSNLWPVSREERLAGGGGSKPPRRSGGPAPPLVPILWPSPPKGEEDISQRIEYEQGL